MQRFWRAAPSVRPARSSTSRACRRRRCSTSRRRTGSGRQHVLRGQRGGGRDAHRARLPRRPPRRGRHRRSPAGSTTRARGGTCRRSTRSASSPTETSSAGGVPTLRPPARRDGARRGRRVRSCSRSATTRAARGAHVYAEVTGFGGGHRRATASFTPDPAAPGLVARDHRGASRGRTRRRPTSTTSPRTAAARALGDASEARAFRAVFGGRRDLLASSVKPATGHLVGGAGALNAAVAALAVSRGAVPPTLNLDELDPACDGLDWVPGAAREAQVGLALALARGLEGQNVALVLRAP